jgi:hypothetical protein
LALLQQAEAGAHPRHVHIVDTLRNMFRGFLSDLSAQPSPEPQQQATTEIATATAAATGAPIHD